MPKLGVLVRINMKVAVVHDWLVGYAGGERVLEQILFLYPDADLFSLVENLSDDRAFILNKKVYTSFINKLPFAKKAHQKYLPLMPLAVEQFDLSDYDLVISSSAAISKGVITGPDQLHISYCHTPMRYAWDLQHQYLKEAGLDTGVKGWLIKWMLHKIRLWDYRTANGVDAFVANSHFIARRIHKVYRRDSEVIYPPVDVDCFTVKKSKDDFYLAASRLVPYKKINLIVEAFSSMPEKRLVVIGGGPDLDRIKQNAAQNVEVLGYQSSDVLRDYMQRAKGFVFAALEDFGIMPVEAQACGTPVIAYGKGGVLESVVTGETGVFYDKQDVNAIIEAVSKFELQEFDADIIRKNAERFSINTFRENFSCFVENQYDAFIDQQSKI